MKKLMCVLFLILGFNLFAGQEFNLLKKDFLSFVNLSSQTFDNFLKLGYFYQYNKQFPSNFIGHTEVVTDTSIKSTLKLTPEAQALFKSLGQDSNTQDTIFTLEEKVDKSFELKLYSGGEPEIISGDYATIKIYLTNIQKQITEESKALEKQ